MVRFLDDLLLFFVPFALFATYLIIVRRKVLDLDNWRSPAPWLTLAGLIFVTGSLFYAGLAVPRSTGAYEPPHMENGVLVPGRFK